MKKFYGNISRGRQEVEVGSINGADERAILSYLFIFKIFILASEKKRKGER